MTKLQDALSKLNKTYGQNSIERVKNLGDIDVKRFSSGSLALNIELGGGYPVGRVIEIYGPESSGKTTLTLHAMAEVQKNGGTCAFIDAEHALDIEYAEDLGVDVEELLLSQPDNGEQALEICDTLVNTGEVRLIIIDSVAALVPKSEIDGEMGDASIGKLAKLMAQAMRKIAPAAKRNDCTVIFINQIRMKIGVMFGSPETQPGGQALKFTASQRIDIRRGQQVKDGDVVIGNQTKIKVIKNKVGRPFGVAHTLMQFGVGIVKESEIAKIGVDHEIIKKSGSHYSYGDIKLGQGEQKVISLLRDNPDLCDEIEEKIIDKIS